MKKEDYSKYTKAELKKLIADLMMRIMRTYGFTETKKSEKPQNRKKLRKEIARIKTELNSRREKENENS